MTVFDKLAAPFEADELEHRLDKSVGNRAMCLVYVKDRAIQHRLDEVIGPARWQARMAASDKGVICGIGILIEREGGLMEWVWKENGCEYTDFSPFKGACSGASKRAAASGWGIGRYLYEGPETWVDLFGTEEQAVAAHPEAGKPKVGKVKGSKSFWFPPSEAAPGHDEAFDNSPPPRPSRESMKAAHDADWTGSPADLDSWELPATPAPSAAPGGVPSCQYCSGQVWDNREDKRNPKAPDYKCKNKQGCGAAAWINEDGSLYWKQ